MSQMITKSTFNFTLTQFLLVLVAVAFTCTSTGCGLVNGLFGEMPHEKALEEKFVKNRALFETLVQMSEADNKVIRIAYDFTWVEGENNAGEMGRDRPIGFSEKRWDEYREIFNQLEISGGLTRLEDGSGITFIAGTTGIATSGSMIGYLYSKVSRSCGHISLDDPQSVSTKSFACKEIGPDWYLFLTR